MLHALMQQFCCTKCGKCCKADPSTNDEYFHIRLFDFEMQKLKKTADANKITYEPAQYISDAKSEKNLVIFYKLKSRDCPFLIDNLCSVYDNRPVLCRAFPVITSGRGTHPEVITSGLCPGNSAIGPKPTSIKEFAHIYSSNYFYCYLFEELCRRQKEIIQTLIKDGQIIPTQRNPNLPFIDITPYLQSRGMEFDVEKITQDIREMLA